MLRQLATIILLPVGFEDLHMYVDPDFGQSFLISFFFDLQDSKQNPLNMYFYVI